MQGRDPLLIWFSSFKILSSSRVRSPLKLVRLQSNFVWLSVLLGFTKVPSSYLLKISSKTLYWDLDSVERRNIMFSFSCFVHLQQNKTKVQFITNFLSSLVWEYRSPFILLFSQVVFQVYRHHSEYIASFNTYAPLNSIENKKRLKNSLHVLLYT